VTLQFKSDNMEIWQMTRGEFQASKCLGLPPDNVDVGAINREFWAAVDQAIAQGSAVPADTIEEWKAIKKSLGKQVEVQREVSKPSAGPSNPTSRVIAREIVILDNSRVPIPPGYSYFAVGDQSVTRYVKAHSETIYVLKKFKRTRWGSGWKATGYYAPSSVVASANGAAMLDQHCDQAATTRPKPTEPHPHAGIAAEKVRDVFLNLDHAVLRNVFRVYRQVHGKKRHEYARRTYQAWKTGTRQMTPELAHRLLSIVPPLLDFQQKYDLFELIWRRCLPIGRTEDKPPRRFITTPA
jgi:hypothetical protein